MQVLDDIWASIKGNAKARYRDPLIGTFIVSWCFCNWDKLAILFWGSKKIEERVNSLASSMSVISDLTLLYKDIDLIIIPTIITIGYLFLLPWVSLWVKEKQNNAVILQHTHTVDLALRQAKKQRELNKERLRTNSEKEFLGKDLDLDLQREKDRVERRNKIKEYIDQKVKAANALSERVKAEAEAAQSIAAKEKLQMDDKNQQAKKEKQRFDEQSTIHKATMASHRFPAAYYFMGLLSSSLKDDGIVLSINGLSSCVAALFGYEKFNDLINDKNFNNENLNQLRYILLNDDLAKNLEIIVELEQLENENVDSELIFNHIYDLFEDLPYEILSEDSLAETLCERINENAYDLLQGDELSGPMAETDTIFDEIELGMDEFNFDVSFIVQLIGSASGSHRRESDMAGRDLDINAEAQCSPILGQFGLKDYELEISGSPRDYG
jgi:hypothetical protein